MEIPKWRILTVAVILFSVLLGASPFILDETSLSFVSNETNMSVTVVSLNATNSTTLGMNSDPELGFGTLPEGSNATKFLNVSVARKSLLGISTEGNISDYLHYEDKMYFNGRKEIPIEARGRSPGNYTGNITLKFQLPENRVGEEWLDLKAIYYGLE